jgi:phosphoglycolate phosphatase
MKRTTVIFDLDGTLLDTLADLADACNYALAAVGEPERTLDEVRQFVGNGLGKLMERAIPGGRSHPRFQEALDILQRYYQAHNQVKTQPYEGIRPLLAQLHQRGAALAIVSNKPDTSVKMLNEEYFGSWVEVAIGERQGVRRKPAPDTVLEALRVLGQSRETAVYVGDSEVDIATAQNAGIPCISVTWGFRPRAELAAAGATCYADTPEGLLSLLLEEA